MSRLVPLLLTLLALAGCRSWDRFQFSGDGGPDVGQADVGQADVGQADVGQADVGDSGPSIRYCDTLSGFLTCLDFEDDAASMLLVSAGAGSCAFETGTGRLGSRALACSGRAEERAHLDQPIPAAEPALYIRAHVAITDREMPDYFTLFTFSSSSGLYGSHGVNISDTGFFGVGPDTPGGSIVDTGWYDNGFACLTVELRNEPGGGVVVDWGYEDSRVSRTPDSTPNPRPFSGGAFQLGLTSNQLTANPSLVRMLIDDVVVSTSPLPCD